LLVVPEIVKVPAPVFWRVPVVSAICPLETISAPAAVVKIKFLVAPVIVPEIVKIPTEEPIVESALSVIAPENVLFPERLSNDPSAVDPIPLMAMALANVIAPEISSCPLGATVIAPAVPKAEAFEILTAPEFTEVAPV
jgi:hypothetical protein